MDCTTPRFRRLRVQPELLPTFGGNHALMPGRVPHQFDIGFFDLVERQEFRLHVRGDLSPHVATGRGQGHFHVNNRPVDDDVVDQAKVDDVERYLGIIAIAQLIPDLLLTERCAGRHGNLFLLHRRTLSYASLPRNACAISIKAWPGGLLGFEMVTGTPRSPPSRISVKSGISPRNGVFWRAASARPPP